MYERILVPLDGSELAEAVLPHALALAEKFGSEVVLLRVVHTRAEVMRDTVTATAGPGTAELGIDVADRQQAAERTAADAYLEKTRQSLEGRGLKLRAEVREGAPETAILDLARETGSDLIAMSTHGRSGLGRAVFGSVADVVLRNSRLPVLLIRPADI